MSDITSPAVLRSTSGRCRVPVRLPTFSGFGLNAQQLLAIVPFVQRLCLVEALVALEADQVAPGRPGHGLGQFGLAHSRRALHEHGLAEALRQVGDQGCGLVREVPHLAQ
jgi:hypothetical protein